MTAFKKLFSVEKRLSQIKRGHEFVLTLSRWRFSEGLRTLFGVFIKKASFPPTFSGLKTLPCYTVGWDEAFQKFMVLQMNLAHQTS